jgi:hypothetical protein
MQYEPADGFLGTSQVQHDRQPQHQPSINAVWTFTRLKWLNSAQDVGGGTYETQRVRNTSSASAA